MFSKESLGVSTKKKKNKRNLDLLTLAYDVSGKAYRNSPIGRATKFAITNDVTKSFRNLLIDKTLGDKEHIGAFAKYLTGGTVGNKPITELSDTQLDAVKWSHHTNQYPERQSGRDPNSNLLSTYMTRMFDHEVDGKEYQPTQRTSGFLGHANLKVDEQTGDARLTDVWDVDKDKKYKPARGMKHFDLQEGFVPVTFGKKRFKVPVASMAYDAATWLGINRDMNIDVRIPAERLSAKTIDYMPNYKPEIPINKPAKITKK